MPVVPVLLEAVGVAEAAVVGAPDAVREPVTAAAPEPVGAPELPEPELPEPEPPEPEPPEPDEPEPPDATALLVGAAVVVAGVVVAAVVVVTAWLCRSEANVCWSVARVWLTPATADSRSVVSKAAICCPAVTVWPTLTPTADTVPATGNDAVAFCT
nr:hypothetical protein [Nakamurella sp. PAMC28650]